eukprot:UN06214
MSERLNSPSTSNLKRIRSKSANRIYKAGPRDIGRQSGKSWTPIKLSKEEKAKLNEGSFLTEKRSRRSKSQAIKQKKKNPAKHLKAESKNIEKGSSSWTPIKLSKQEKAKLNSGRFLDDRIKVKGKRKRAKSAQPQTRTRSRVYKSKKQNNKLNSNNGKPKKQKSKRFKIAVNEKFVDPKTLTKSKAKNKELMTGKKVRKKGRE